MKKYINKDKSLNIDNILKDWNPLFTISRFSNGTIEQYLLEIKEDTNPKNIFYITNIEAQTLISKLNLKPVTNEKYPFYTKY
jgi:hypothetical protein